MESYCMITPDGRLYQDTDYKYHYSESILRVGLLKAIMQVEFNQERYKTRKGDYFKDIFISE